MITREEAVLLLKTYLKDDHDLMKKSFAVEHIMGTLSHLFDEDEQLWALTGLLHDLDYEYTERNPENHTEITAKLLDGLLPQEGIDAIKSHNYIHTGVIPSSMLDKALLTSDATATLILIVAKEKESYRKVSQAQVLRTYKDKSYDEHYPKEWLRLCSDLNLTVKEFFKISLASFKEIIPFLEKM